MVACRACGIESPGEFKYCPACGAELVAAPPQAATTTEERRVVSALFCDLVGFTSASETADPEDVDRALSAYAAMARREIEYHGGVVEKFIGDAVVGVFGVPTAHEDDALRAVRAGLGIRARAGQLEGVSGAPLRLRIGINTGEVLARVSVEPGSGERFLAGDAINTAARIQSAAPEMGVAVGIGTYRATKGRIEYEELELVTLKGKADPVRVFHAIGAEAPTGVDLTRSEATTYIGRQDELDRLTALLESTRNGTPVRLVTVIGEAGMGKSRITAELRALTQNGAGPVTWRQGRCLPYGEGIAFWALGEIVKAHAGILESDSPVVAQEKLMAVLPPGPRQPWLRERMLPLIGLEAGPPANRDESFAAWRTFIQGMATDRPAVLVVEDLHWADASMLDFLEHLAREAEHGPLLLLATARPELLTRRPNFAASLPNADRLELAPLSTGETAELVGSLVGAVVPKDLAGPIIERADGNPLYAEEYVRLLRDRDLLVEADDAVALRPGVELPLPESIHALLTARLDTLPADRKALLGDAAVVGKVFWDGAIQEMSGRGADDVQRALAALLQLGFLRLASQSSMAGEREYAFWHVLGRDVAYRQLPRGSRAAKHAAAATWLQRKLGERVDDIADVLADHWGTALELARAARQTDRAREFEPKAILFLMRAGERAMGLDVAAAVARFEAAMALATPGHPDRADILVRFAQTATYLDRFDETFAALDEAITEYEARGDWRSRARALVVMARAAGVDVDSHDERATSLDRALALLADHEPTQELADALTERGIDLYFASRTAEAIEILDRALAIASELGLPTPVRTLGFRGNARLDYGHAAGMDDMRAAIALSVATGQGRDIAINKVNTGVWTSLYEGPEAGMAVIREAIDDAARFGFASLADGMTLMSLQVLEDEGAYDDALASWDRLNVPGDPAMLQTHGAQYRIYARRGRRDEALAGVDELEEIGRRESVDPEYRVNSLATAAVIRSTFGDLESGCGLIEELLMIPDGRVTQSHRATRLPSMVRIALDAGDGDLAERVIQDLEPRFPYAEHAQVAARATVAEARGRFEDALAGYRDAASRWERFTMPLEQAYARLGEARCLIGLGRGDDAADPLARGRAIFERLGVAGALTQVEAVQETALRPPIKR